jgi:ornithine carbamoyltransferase
MFSGGRDAMQHLISIQDLSLQEIIAIFRRTDGFKRKPIQPVLRNKNLAMIFQKPSTRTRVSFEVAMKHLGGNALYLNAQDLRLGWGETVADTARTLSRYCDGIMARVFSHRDMLELAKYSGVPVINGLSDLLHPCQALGDMFTIHEKLGRLSGLRLAYTGNARNNVTHSLLYACSKLGMNIAVACPAEYGPDGAVLRESRANARSSGAVIEVVSDPRKAVKGADIVYTDSWTPMEPGKKPSLNAFRPYQLNPSLLGCAKRNALVMHCLPAHRGKEITDSVLDGPQSIVWDQAGNRMHVQKGILSLLM